MDKLRAGIDFIFSSYKRTAGVLFFAGLVLMLPIILSQVGQQQDIRQRAQEVEPSPAQDFAWTSQEGVYYPPENYQNIDPIEGYVPEDYVWDYNVDPVPSLIENQCWEQGTCDNFIPDDAQIYTPPTDPEAVIPYVDLPAEQKIPYDFIAPEYIDGNFVDEGVYYCQKEPAFCFLGDFWTECQDPYTGWCSPDPTPVPCTPLPEKCVNEQGEITCYFFAYPPGGWCPTTPGPVCPADAKVCSDGSYVVRNMPNCEFAPCPGEPIPFTPTPTPAPVCKTGINSFSATSDGCGQGTYKVVEIGCYDGYQTTIDAGSCVGFFMMNTLGNLACKGRTICYEPTPPGGPVPTISGVPVCNSFCLRDADCQGAADSCNSCVAGRCQTFSCAASKAKGDANCDSKTDTDDFNTWRDEFLAFRNISATPPPPKSDFNGDGTVNTDDFNLWRDGFLGTLPVPTSTPSACPTPPTCSPGQNLIHGDPPPGSGACPSYSCLGPTATPTPSNLSCEWTQSCTQDSECPSGTQCINVQPVLNDNDPGVRYCLSTACPLPL
jgi:hypothetical protein